MASFLIMPIASLHAQDSDFNLTYHVERTPADALDLTSCGTAVEQAARSAGFSVNVQRFPQQLVIVSGGEKGRGVFTVQCIAVGDVTVSVVQGIDYQPGRGPLATFADNAYAAILASRK